MGGAEELHRHNGGRRARRLYGRVRPLRGRTARAFDDGLRGALEADRIGAQRIHTVTVSADEDERGFSVTVRYHTPFSVDGDPADVEAATLDDARELLDVVEDTGERFSTVTLHPTIESDGGYVTASNVRLDGDAVDEYDWDDVAPDEITSIAYDYEFDDGLFEA